MAVTHFAPFTAHFKIVPARSAPGRAAKRFESIRDSQRIAALAYDALLDESTLTIAMPGGGQARLATQFSSHRDGLAIKPQFGETPAQMSITGFSEVTGDVSAPWSEKQVYNDNTVKTGPSTGAPWSATASPASMPTAAVDAEVKALRTLLESTINNAMPDGVVPITLFRINYKGVIYGDRGFTFPR